VLSTNGRLVASSQDLRSQLWSPHQIPTLIGNNRIECECFDKAVGKLLIALMEGA